MKIIDTILFAYEYEKEVLLAKFNLESEVVDKFLVIESEYTFRGQYKGFQLTKVLEDKRFEPFKEKIKHLKIKGNTFENMGLSHIEKDYFKIEHFSRAYCMDYLVENYDDNDLILITDSDEAYDFSDPVRRDVLLKIFKENSDRGTQQRNIKMWFDWDNACFWSDKYLPSHRLKLLKNGSSSFYNKVSNCITTPTPILTCFEWAYAFPAEANWNKVNSFAHDKYTLPSMDRAYLGNHWHREPARGEILGRDPFDWFETIVLTEENSPKYVRENLENLKVNTINPNYAEYRVQNYRISPHPAMNYGFLGNNKIKKECNYYKR
jgi:hypothetical protein